LDAHDWGRKRSSRPEMLDAHGIDKLRVIGWPAVFQFWISRRVSDGRSGEHDLAWPPSEKSWHVEANFDL
jgi:hypothetical protein